MAARALLPRMASQFVRMCPVISQATAGVRVVLADDLGQSRYRARGSAKYRVKVGFSWLGFANDYDIVDGRGVPVSWTFADVSAWLVKTLAGWSISVEIAFDGGRLSQAWDKSRADSMLNWLNTFAAQGWIDAAERLRERADKVHANDPKKAELLARAEALDGLALAHGACMGWINQQAGSV